MAETKTFPIESTTVERFLGRFVFDLYSQHRKSSTDRNERMDEIRRLRDGHPVTLHHNIGSVDFYLMWFGEQKWTIKTGQWSLHSKMIESSVTGDEAAFIRDMTMLMMAADVEES